MTEHSKLRSNEPKRSDYTSLSARDEKLLRVYEKQRDEIAQQIRITNRATLRGVVAVGAIVGYAVSSGVQVIVGLVPVAMAYVFAKTVHTNMWIRTLGLHVAEIERELVVGNSPVKWEIRRGGVVGEEYGSGFWHSGLKVVPGIARALLALVGYAAAIGYTMVFAWPDTTRRVAVFGLHPIWGWIGYGLLTLLILSVGAVYLYHRRTAVRDFDRSDDE